MKWDAFDDIRTPAAWLDQAKELTETPRRRRTWSPRTKGALIAACLCVAVVGTAFAVELIGQVTLAENKAADAYSISADVVLWPMDELGGQLLEDAKEDDFRQLFFDSWEEVEEYWGVPLIRNTLLPAPKCVAVNLYEWTALDPEVLRWTVANTACIIENTRITLRAFLYTEAYTTTEDDGTPLLYTQGASSDANVTYTQYEMGNGTISQIVRYDPPDDSAFVPTYDAYFVRDGIFYDVTLNLRPADETQPEADYEQLLYDILDAFE